MHWTIPTIYPHLTSHPNTYIHRIKSLHIVMTHTIRHLKWKRINNKFTLAHHLIHTWHTFNQFIMLLLYYLKNKIKIKFHKNNKFSNFIFSFICLFWATNCQVLHGFSSFYYLILFYFIFSTFLIDKSVTCGSYVFNNIPLFCQTNSKIEVIYRFH